ncbi:hypothetical protein KL864_27025 [Mycolicibacterium goodii]|uniref:hypothetical protein n=1 Tax=Mycolicibacterium goodii TaxID=134601 RepID=UPI001BDCB92C|nr:hypothetical protein [Mycolicibacterium goodii]MBU8819543.1 hypothetical protein [Mycolicibacterium goodii]
MAATDPVEAEATGQRLVSAEFAGRSWLIPLDVDTWPIDAVLGSIRVREVDGKTVFRPDRAPIAHVLQQLLGEQWTEFLDAAPRVRDLVAASQVFAAAVGIPAEPQHPLDIAFGAIPRLLLTIAQYPDAVEATLTRLNLDYRDRWRLDDNGDRRLTLRRISVELKYAPRDFPLAVARNGGKAPLSSEAMIMADVYEAITHVTHPARAFGPRDAAQRQQSKQKKAADAVADYKARHAKPAARKSALDIARSNANALRGIDDAQTQAQISNPS